MKMRINLAIFLLLISSSLFAEVYRCETKNPSDAQAEPEIMYSNKPCPKGSGTKLVPTNDLIMIVKPSDKKQTERPQVKNPMKIQLRG